MTARVEPLRKTVRKIKSPLPQAVTDRTDRLVEIDGHLAAAKASAEAAGEDFLVYLLSMSIVETRSAMRRATLGAPAATRKRLRKHS